MTTTITNCVDPDDTIHEHCPLHGCVEYLCCMPTSAVSLYKNSFGQLAAQTIVEQTRRMRENALIAYYGRLELNSSTAFEMGADESPLKRYPRPYQI